MLRICRNSSCASCRVCLLSALKNRATSTYVYDFFFFFYVLDVGGAMYPNLINRAPLNFFWLPYPTKNLRKIEPCAQQKEVCILIFLCVVFCLAVYHIYVKKRYVALLGSRVWLACTISSTSIPRTKLRQLFLSLVRANVCPEE